MDIILRGLHSSDEVVENLDRVLKLFNERYHVGQYCEVHLSVTLVDDQGDVVELVDSKSNQVYRIFEVYSNTGELAGQHGMPLLQLVVDNTK